MTTTAHTSTAAGDLYLLTFASRSAST